MANEYEYDYRRGRRERQDEPYSRGQGGYEEEYYQGYGSELPRYGYGRGGYYGEPYRGGRYGEPSGGYGYEGYEYGGRPSEPYYQRGREGEYRERYYRGGYGRGREERGREDRGFFERAGEEIKSWFGGGEDEERRRRQEEMRRGMYAGRGPRGYQRSDERIREDVNDRLTDDWYIDATDVEVSVNNGVVTLTGRVNSREEKRRAEDIVESVSGVKDVSNQLRVGQSATGATESETAGAARARTART